MSAPTHLTSHHADERDAAHAVVDLLDQHGPKIHALALRLCGNRADADDMVQDVFLTALRKWHTFRHQANPGTWLYAIALRSCKHRLRAKGGTNTRVPAMSQLMPWAESTVMESAAATSDQDPVRREAVEAVHTAVASLPEHLRVPLILKEMLELPLADVAATLGLEVNTVKTRLHRARLALRKAMTAQTPAVSAPPPLYEKQVCLDLLKAKLEAMDQGRPFQVPQAELCARCRAVFRELDVVQHACVSMARGQLPPELRDAITRAISERSAAQSGAPRRKGRPPVSRARS
jgi:RNA polymerase sigma-70 factor (ECF subfamily)